MVYIYFTFAKRTGPDTPYQQNKLFISHEKRLFPFKKLPMCTGFMLLALIRACSSLWLVLRGTRQMGTRSPPQPPCNTSDVSMEVKWPQVTNQRSVLSSLRSSLHFCLTQTLNQDQMMVRWGLKLQQSSMWTGMFLIASIMMASIVWKESINI